MSEVLRDKIHRKISRTLFRMSFPLLTLLLAGLLADSTGFAPAVADFGGPLATPTRSHPARRATSHSVPIRMIPVLDKSCALPELGTEGFTLSSYNVLLPNSSDGWWISKYYQSHVPTDQRAWPHRARLTKANVLGTSGGADIVCVQETSADSFESDFEFMAEAGYDHVLHSKFRFRTATFFKRDKFELKSEKHGDRTLVTLLTLKRMSQEATKDGERSLFVVNCHLTGGPNADKRLRQVHDACEFMRKEINKMTNSKPTAKKGAQAEGKGPEVQVPAPTAVVICGDFNEEGDTGVKKLLTEGLVPANFSREGLILTTKVRDARECAINHVNTYCQHSCEKTYACMHVCVRIRTHRTRSKFSETSWTRTRPHMQTRASLGHPHSSLAILMSISSCPRPIRPHQLRLPPNSWRLFVALGSPWLGTGT